MANIEVIGAGIAGIWQALTLQSRGASVTLWDPSGAPSATAVARLAGAMLAPYCEGEAGHEIVRELGLEGLSLWRKHYSETKMVGTLVVSLPRDQSELARFASITTGHLAVDNAQIQTLEPALGDRFARGLYYEGEGFVEPLPALEALTNKAKALGVRVIERAYSSDDEHNSDADFIIDCRGIAAKDYFKTLRGVRGERFVVCCQDLTLTRPIRLIHPRVSFYIVPWADHRFLIGATVIESEDESEASLRSTLELFSAGYALLPQLGEARILELATGVRPAFADNMPKVLVTGRKIRVNGFYRHGFLLSPLLGAITADYIETGKRREGVVFEDLGQW